MLSNAFQIISPEIVKRAIDALQAGIRTGYSKYAWQILGAVF